MNLGENQRFILRCANEKDFLQIQSLCQRVYPFVPPWNLQQLNSHQKVFSRGQLVVENKENNCIVGLAFSLIVNWDDYSMKDSWKDFTDHGYFTNHDPQNGKTLYGAEVMVDPGLRGMGLGKLLYEGRRQICQELGLLRIRAGARLRGYGTYAKELSPVEYLRKVVQMKVFDPTLSFQLKQGFKVLDIVQHYLGVDPESHGHAAVIEWLNPEIAKPQHYQNQKISLAKILGESS